MVFKINQKVRVTNKRDRYYGAEGVVQEIANDHVLVLISGSVLQYFSNELEGV